MEKEDLGGMSFRRTVKKRTEGDEDEEDVEEEED